MIDNLDGTRRLPTKEEILQGVRERRRQSTIQSNGNSIKTAIRSDFSATNEDRRFNNPRPRTSYESNGRDSTYESDTGSGDSTNDGIRGQTGRTGNSYSSDDEYNHRSTTGLRDSTNTEQQSRRTFSNPLKKSIFQPYSQAIKESFKERSKKKAEAPKTKTKVFSEAEAKASREKLITVILWQSDHTDEFMIATVKGHKTTFYHVYPLGIWSNIDKAEATIIADFLIARAKVNPQMARVVRELVILEERIQLAVIFVPRLYKSVMLYLQYGFSIR